VITVHYDPGAAKRLAALLRIATAAGIALQASDDQRLTLLAGTSRHQGVVALARPFPYVELDQIISRKRQLLVVADQIQDPHNLGALIRTAEAVGAGAVVLPKDGAVAMTATVEAAAAGAAALEPVCRVTNIARTLLTLKRSGYWSMALVPNGGLDLYQAELPRPSVVVVGGEAGLRPLVAKQCDVAVSIPMCGKVESLNASVAAAVTLYELFRRWRT
jgi:23S rRNA (guanosine2251-2'-O)-methyltransferase